MFKINGIVNKENIRIRGSQCLMEQNPTVLNSSGVTNWCTISNERFTSLFEQKNVPEETYQTILNNNTFQLF